MQKNEGHGPATVPRANHQSANRQMTTYCLASAEQAGNNKLAICNCRSVVGNLHM